MELRRLLSRIGGPAGPGLLLLTISALACAQERPQSGAGSSDSTQMSATADTVQVSLHLPEQVQAGDSVPITVRVQNTGSRRVDLSLMGREIAFDVVINTSSGQPVWRRLERATLQSILQVKSLEPGEAFELNTGWRAAQPGEYLVSAQLPTDNQPLVTRTPVPLRVVPRR